MAARFNPDASLCGFICPNPASLPAMRVLIAASIVAPLTLLGCGTATMTCKGSRVSDIAEVPDYAQSSLSYELQGTLSGTKINCRVTRSGKCAFRRTETVQVTRETYKREIHANDAIGNTIALPLGAPMALLQKAVQPDMKAGIGWYLSENTGNPGSKTKTTDITGESRQETKTVFRDLTNDPAPNVSVQASVSPSIHVSASTDSSGLATIDLTEILDHLVASVPIDIEVCLNGV